MPGSSFGSLKTTFDWNKGLRLYLGWLELKAGSRFHGSLLGQVS
jgi:hypothetical protein